MKRISQSMALVLAVAGAPLGAAHASVTTDLDTKLVTFKNDGDGMQYVVTKGEKVSIKYHDIWAYPLDAQAKRRYAYPDGNKNDPVATAKPGSRGLQSSRPLADAEVAEVSEGLLKLNNALGASALALDPNADPGPVISHFDAWHSASREDCKITLYEKAMDICGTKIGRAGIVNWTMFREGGYNAFGFVGTHNFTIGYQSREGRRGVSFRFAHNGTAAKFIQELSAWGGSSPQRI